MKQEHFHSHVATLMKNPALIHLSLTDTKVALVHAGLGLAGETFELNEVLLAIQSDNTKDHNTNFVEELGDLLFYATDIHNIMNSLGYAVIEVPFEVQGNTPAEDLAAINKTVDGIVNLIKALFAYNAELSDHYKGDEYIIAVRICMLVAELYNNIQNVANAIDTPVEVIREHNYNKLKARYPEGYTDLAASERADKDPERV